MSAKFIYNLSDEHPDVEKQIGCMNGIFQLFDRSHFLGGSRRYVPRHHKRLPSPGQNGSCGTELKRASQNTKENDHKKSIKEKHTLSTESSRTSFSSSSCSSSLSSLESIRATQLEPSSFSQTTTQESYRRDLPAYQSNASLLSSRQSPDFWEVVKDSIYRETRGISVKTASNGETKGRTLKYIDSPRPLQHQKFVEPKSSGRKESTRAHQLRDIPCKSNERTCSSFSPSLKDVRRLSLDGTESREAIKSSMKLKEHPRLSLDSKASSVKGSISEMTRNYLIQGVARNGNTSNFQNQQEPGSNRRQSSVVAKLMGLELLPELVSTNENQERELRAVCGLENDPCLQSSRTTKEKNQNRNAGSPRYPSKESSSPRLKTADSVKKHTAKSKPSNEAAPWSEPKGSICSSSPAFSSQATPTKIQNSSVSVYSKIEKRLAQLEFKSSGEDLRALKQILEAMQKSKETFEIRSDALGCVSDTSRNSHLDPNSNLESQRLQLINNMTSSSTMGTSSSESFNSPIVIMKPAKKAGKASYSACQVNQTDDLGLHRLVTADSAGGSRKANKQPNSKNIIGTITKDPILKFNDLSNPASHPTRILEKRTSTRLVRLSTTTKEAQSTTRESRDLEKASRTTNPRHREKKIELEKDSCPITPSTTLNSVRRQSSGELTQTGSPRRKLRTKSTNLQLGGDVSSEGRDPSQHGDPISKVFESNVTTAFPVDEEGIDKSDKHIKTLIQKTCERQKESEARLIEDKSNSNPAIAPSEQPSPVSVLDATFYNDELPSPIKKISTSFKADDIYSEELGWNGIDACHSSSSMNSLNSSFVVDHGKVENIMPLIQHLKQILSANKPITEELTLYNSTSSEHQYISEIILASGFLKDFEPSCTATQLNPTTYPIEPNFFLALEQAKASIRRSDEESGQNKAQPKLAKTQRKLLFDVVNELIQKLTLESPSRMLLAPGTMANKVPRGLPLLQELFSEVDRLKSCSFDNEDNLTRISWEDMVHQPQKWKSGNREIPGLVLDIERLIFKDLISEVVRGETNYLQRRPAGHCRQLFSN